MVPEMMAHHGLNIESYSACWAGLIRRPVSRNSSTCSSWGSTGSYPKVPKSFLKTKLASRAEVLVSDGISR